MRKKYTYLPAVLVIIVLLGAGYQVFSKEGNTMNNDKDAMKSMPEGSRAAVFAGGCFWCTESDFEKVDGVIEAVSGYTGGHVPNPEYKQVSSGITGHVEAVRVIYDPEKISYERLLEIFWRTVDPTDAGGQFCDRGSQYRSVIFYADESERNLAETSREKLASSSVFQKPIATDILPLETFYPAEDYHQDYYLKNPLRYKFYRTRCGREDRLVQLWGQQAGNLAIIEKTTNKPR